MMMMNFTHIKLKEIKNDEVYKNLKGEKKKKKSNWDWKSKNGIKIAEKYYKDTHCGMVAEKKHKIWRKKNVCAKCGSTNSL